MGCAQSKCLGGGGAGAGEGSFRHDGFRVRREDKLPSFDSSLTARPSQQEEVHKPRAAPSSALSSVSYGSLAEQRNSEPGAVQMPGAEDARREEGGRRESDGGSDDSEVDSTAVRLFSFLGGLNFMILRCCNCLFFSSSVALPRASSRMRMRLLLRDVLSHRQRCKDR